MKKTIKVKISTIKISAIILFLILCLAQAQDHMDLMKGLEGGEHEGTAQQITAPVLNLAQHLSSSYYKLFLSLGIGISTIFLLALVIRGVTKAAKYTASDIVTAAGLIVVVQGTLFVVIASSSTEALTASIGLLGAVGGYIFAKGDKKG